VKDPLKKTIPELLREAAETLRRVSGDHDSEYDDMQYQAGVSWHRKCWSTLHARETKEDAVTNLWVKSVDVRVGDVILAFRALGVETTIRATEVTSLRQETNGSFVVTTTGVFTSDAQSELEWHVERAETHEVWVKVGEVRVGDTLLAFGSPNAPVETRAPRLVKYIVNGGLTSNFDPSDDTFCTGGDPDFTWLVRRSGTQESPASVAPAMSHWNGKCPRCGANTYQGAWKLDHEGDCR
jgi:hypothetical protein